MRTVSTRSVLAADEPKRRRQAARKVSTALATALTVGIAWLAPGSAPADPSHEAPSGQRDGMPRHGGVHHHGRGDHEHAPVPKAYENAHLPASAWTNPKLIARGRQIYRDKCLVCHGERGDGNGPGASGLALKPPDFTNPDMTDEMASNYWFWRVSEGGQVEPFRSKGSAMPAWKHELPVEDRWAVIAYQHTFSGHEGPHVPSEHSALPRRRSRPAGGARGAPEPCLKSGSGRC
jgi:mono/diheme cytochrome c family protein